jgi:hypothetical protein
MLNQSLYLVVRTRRPSDWGDDGSVEIGFLQAESLKDATADAREAFGEYGSELEVVEAGTLVRVSTIPGRKIQD